MNTRLWPLAAAGLALAAATPAVADCKLKEVIELPVTMAGFRAQATLFINGRPAKFNIDSGSDFSLIDPDAAAALGLKLADTGMYAKGVGGRSRLSFTTIKNLGLSKDLSLGEVDMLVTPHAGDSGAVGLLGENILGFADIEYDLPHGAIRFFKQDGCQGANLGYWADGAAIEVDLTHTAKLNLSRDRDPNKYDPATTDRHIRAQVLVNGQKINATFDTGSPASLLDRTAAARAGVTPDTPGAVPMGVFGGIGADRKSAWIAPFNSFAVGGERINHTRLRFGDLGETQTDMLLGADFFLSHRIFIANSLSKAFISYTGGPVFNLTPGAASRAPMQSAASDSPKADDPDAGFRSASAMISRRDFAGALALLDAVIAAEPSRADAHVLRASARQGLGDGVGAMADLDAALKLDPTNFDALLARGARLARQRNMARARQDLDLAAAQKTPDGRARLHVAAVYEGVGDHPDAILQYDALIAEKPTDELVAAAYNGRCWNRALMAEDLDRAVADCNQALRLEPRNPDILDSRALAHMRRGELDLALADYDAAIRAQPPTAITLYARAAARLKKGLAADSAADVAAAKKLDPNIGDRAKAAGVVSADFDSGAGPRP